MDRRKPRPTGPVLKNVKRKWVLSLIKVAGIYAKRVFVESNP